MSKTTRRAASLAVAATVAGGLAVAGTGSAAAAPGGQTCYFHRGSDQVVSAGPFHAGIVNGDCSFVTFGNGFPGTNGNMGTIGLGNVRLPNGQWAVAEVDDVAGVAHLLSNDPSNNMPF
ncbi:MAG: hypothetical protein ACI38U_02215 [Corynebacterium sp.]|uniref:hypothetical protein n=1 Tax=Corynebacterium sp. TaxID=1720 RepID=UPI003F029395